MRQTLLSTLPIAALALAAMTVAASPPASAQNPDSRPAFDSLAREAQLLVLEWLSRDCSTDDRLALEDKLTAIGEPLEPVFWEAYRLGPPADQLEQDGAAIRRRFDVRRKWLAAGNGAELFGAEEVERLAALDGEEYTRRELERIRVGYATAAILGLALVATEQGSTAELSKIADDPENAAAAAAGMALDAITRRSAEP